MLVNNIEASVGTSFIFAEEYAILLATNGIGNDKHQHALANARATSLYGKSGEDIAIDISNWRDNPEEYIKFTKEQIEDAEADHFANRVGRELGLKYPNASREFLSTKLKEEYAIDNQHFRYNVLDALIRRILTW